MLFVVGRGRSGPLPRMALHMLGRETAVRTLPPEDHVARILVTDGEQRSSLAVVRSLGRAGHRVTVCSTKRRPLAGASRFAARVHQVDDPLVRPEDFRKAVAHIIRQEDIGLLLPMTDTSVPILLGLRDQIPGLVVPLPAASAYDAISDKRNLMEVAKRIGVPVPEQVVVHDAPDATLALDRFGSAVPLVLKPARSAVLSPDGVRRFGVRVLARSAALPEALAAFPREAYPILVQERIVGSGLGAFLLTDRGRPIARFGHRRIREKPPTGGVSVYREAVPLRDDIRVHAERILEAFGWTGVAMVEFKEDAATGTPYLMEVNGRFWGSLQLAIDAGVDFPDLLVRMGLGEDLEAAPPARSGVRSRWLWGDVDHLLWLMRYGRRARATDPALPFALTALARFLIPWRPGERLEVLRPTDPGPFLRESVQWLANMTRR